MPGPHPLHITVDHKTDENDYVIVNNPQDKNQNLFTYSYFTGVFSETLCNNLLPSFCLPTIFASGIDAYVVYFTTRSKVELKSEDIKKSLLTSLTATGISSALEIALTCVNMASWWAPAIMVSGKVLTMVTPEKITAVKKTVSDNVFSLWNSRPHLGIIANEVEDITVDTKPKANQM